MVIAAKRVGSKLNLVDSVLHIMGIRDLKTVSKNASLAELGMDSLMAVEIKQALEREFEVILTAQDLRTLTFAKLQELSAGGKGERVLKNSQEESINMADIQKNMIFRSLGNPENAYELLVPLNGVETSDVVALFIPGMEGVASPSIHKLGKSINVPSYALQLHKYGGEEDLNVIIEKIKKVFSNSFHL